MPKSCPPHHFLTSSFAIANSAGVKMISVLLLLFTLAVTFANPVNPSAPDFKSNLENYPVVDAITESRIIDGNKSDPLPFIVSLQRPEGGGRWGHFCGATLITPNRLLTAWHCWDPAKNTDTKFRAVLGTTLTDAPGQVVEFERSDVKLDKYVEKLRLPYNELAHLVNDNAVIQLPKAATINEKVKTVCLAGGDVSAEKYYAAGWGFYDCEPKTSPYLRYALAQPLYGGACEDEYHDKTDMQSFALQKQLCSYFQQPDGRATPPYQGDSGGPLIAEVNGSPVQIGITSFVPLDTKTNCVNMKVPPVYSKVADHQTFIKQHAPEAEFC